MGPYPAILVVICFFPNKQPRTILTKNHGLIKGDTNIIEKKIVGIMAILDIGQTQDIRNRESGSSGDEQEVTNQYSHGDGRIQPESNHV
jgi:hypothetical protein